MNSTHIHLHISLTSIVKFLGILGPDVAFNPSTKQTETCGFWGVQGQPDPQNEFQDSKGLHSETLGQKQKQNTLS